MNDLKQLLKAHYDCHPQMEIQDAVKFLHQSYMGPGHLIQDKEYALNCLDAELAELNYGFSDMERSTEIGNGLVRLNLNCCKANSLSTKTLFSLFYQTAQTWKPNQAGLDKSLDLLYSLPFPTDDVQQFIQKYREAGCPMVSHSETYRRLYHPAYRIVRKEYLHLLPILFEIDSLMEKEKSVRVAIDGPCASGKSTLGRMLSEIYRCPLISMDDFFLRPEQRTTERMGEPGGNVDYERFDQEVLTPLSLYKPVSYRPWHCHQQAFGSVRNLPVSNLTIIEGSYSMRPELRDRYHLRIWAEAPLDVRLSRLLLRDGPEMLERFRILWIPMEDRYFATFSVKECCHLLWDGCAE